MEEPTAFQEAMVIHSMELFVSGPGVLNVFHILYPNSAVLL